MSEAEVVDIDKVVAQLDELVNSRVQSQGARLRCQIEQEIEALVRERLRDEEKIADLSQSIEAVQT
jgi:hypothetical protein